MFSKQQIKPIKNVSYQRGKACFMHAHINHKTLIESFNKSFKIEKSLGLGLSHWPLKEQILRNKSCTLGEASNENSVWLTGCVKPPHTTRTVNSANFQYVQYFKTTGGTGGLFICQERELAHR